VCSCCVTVTSWRLVATKEMALLIVSFAYTGLNLLKSRLIFNFYH